jgi:hypothetical protein
MLSETKSLDLQQQEGRIPRADKDYLCTLKMQACQKCQKKAHYRQSRCLDLTSVCGDMLYCRQRENLATPPAWMSFSESGPDRSSRVAKSVYTEGQRADPIDFSL